MEAQKNPLPSNPQILYRWKAPLRAYKKRSIGVLRFYIALSLLLSLIVFFFGDRILVMPIWALMFLFYVLTITPPPEIEHKITQFGVATGENTYRFDFLSHFYFVKKFDYDVLVVVSHAPYFIHLYLVVPEKQTINHITQLLSKHLVYQEHPHKSFMDRIIEFLTSLMPDSSDAVAEKSIDSQAAQQVAL